MDKATPLRLKLKLGSSTPEGSLSPVHPTIINMAEDNDQIIGSDDEMEDEDCKDDEGMDDEEIADDDKVKLKLFLDDSGRERHKKSKKKKKKKEKEKDRDRHKHRHHRSTDGEGYELPLKRERHEMDSNQAFQEFLDYLLDQLEKKDSQNFFALPVTDSIAPGYSSIINEPMDFSTMREKLIRREYTTLSQFRNNFRLVCNNCMTYNQQDTIYYKAAKKLLHAGERILSPQKIASLKKDLPIVNMLTDEQIGFDLSSYALVSYEDDAVASIEDVPRMEEYESSDKDSINSKFDAIPDDITPEEALERARRASTEAAEKLTQKKPASAVLNVVLVNQTSQKYCKKLNIATKAVYHDSQTGSLGGTIELTCNAFRDCFFDEYQKGCEGNDPNQKERPVSLGLITGKLTQGSSSLHNYREDKRNMAKPVKPLYYGSYASFCPSYDSAFANLTKEESEMVYATYGSETAVQYTESICNFSRDCDMAMHLVDQLLNLLTKDQHSKTKGYIEERKKLQEEEKFSALLYSQNDSYPSTISSQSERESSVDFSSLKSLSDIGVEMSFLSAFEEIEKKEKIVGRQLEENAHFLEMLAKEQIDRLSKVSPSNLTNLPKPSIKELSLVPPGSVAPVPIVRRAMGITMMPVSDSEKKNEGSSEGRDSNATNQEDIDSSCPQVEDFESHLHHLLSQTDPGQMVNDISDCSTK